MRLGSGTGNLGLALGSGRFRTSPILPTPRALGARGGGAGAGASEKRGELVEWRVSPGRGAAGLWPRGGNGRHISFPASGLQPLSSFWVGTFEQSRFAFLAEQAQKQRRYPVAGTPPCLTYPGTGERAGLPALGTPASPCPALDGKPACSRRSRDRPCVPSSPQSWP